MAKKLLMVLGAVLAVVAGVAALSAYEAHIINVTAHIENALTVHPPDRHLDFGTVFPQEYLEKEFSVSLSDSFQKQNRLDDVTYKIEQKPKCKNDQGQYAPVDYATHKCPDGYKEMKSLCPFLSKVDGDPSDKNDTSEPSYYVPGDKPYCRMVSEKATGKLTIAGKDLVDVWIVDLKVPPIRGYVGQDWPKDCPVLDQNPEGEDYGCDLWIEVTGFSLPPRD